MKQYCAQLLATSKAGHDKGKQYVVLGQEGEYFLLVNGSTKLLANPKKKNQKHVQLIKHFSPELSEMMKQIGQDADVRKILKSYHKSEA